MILVLFSLLVNFFEHVPCCIAGLYCGCMLLGLLLQLRSHVALFGFHVFTSTCMLSKVLSEMVYFVDVFVHYVSSCFQRKVTQFLLKAASLFGKSSSLMSYVCSSNQCRRDLSCMFSRQIFLKKQHIRSLVIRYVLNPGLYQYLKIYFHMFNHLLKKLKVLLKIVWRFA